MSQWLLDKIKPIFSPRFLKFCTVGLTGVVVNLGFLAIFADLLDLHVNLASALAIEISILSNFFINELWTFRDRRDGSGTWWSRGLQFHVVSILGGIMQWSVFVTVNMFWMLLLYSPEHVSEYFSHGESFVDRFFVYPIVSPPEVGALKYISQLFGIGVATFWNFLMNFHWTWRETK